MVLLWKAAASLAPANLYSNPDLLPGIPSNTALAWAPQSAFSLSLMDFLQDHVPINHKL